MIDDESRMADDRGQSGMVSPGARLMRSPAHTRRALVLTAAAALLAVALMAPRSLCEGAEPQEKATEPHRSPIALALSADGARLLTANQTSGSVSLIDTESGTVLAELATGEKPAGVALAHDGKRAAVT